MLDSLAEELRVLYVALTRAKEKLIISGTLSRPEEKLAAAVREERGREGTLTYGKLSRAVTYWDWAPSGAGRYARGWPCRCKDPGSRR